METKQEMMNKLLFEAFVMNDEKKVKAFIEIGVDVNATFIGDITPLHLASYRNALELVKLLIDRGADVRAKDRAGSTPLHEACLSNALECTKLLIDRGADVRAKNNGGSTPFDVAQSEEMKALLKQYMKK